MESTAAAHTHGCALFRLEDGQEIDRFTGGSTNMYSVGRDEAMRNTERLLRSSGVSLERLKAGCLGSAGLSRPAEKEAFSAFSAGCSPSAACTCATTAKRCW